MQDIVWKRTLDALDWLLIANFKLVALKMKWFMPDHFSQARLKLHPHLLPFDSVCRVESHPISKLLDSRQTSVALLLLSRTLPTAAALRADFNGCQWTFQKAFKSSYGFPRSAATLFWSGGLHSAPLLQNILQKHDDSKIRKHLPPHTVTDQLTGKTNPFLATSSPFTVSSCLTLYFVHRNFSWAKVHFRI